MPLPVPPLQFLPFETLMSFYPSFPITQLNHYSLSSTLCQQAIERYTHFWFELEKKSAEKVVEIALPITFPTIPTTSCNFVSFFPSSIYFRKRNFCLLLKEGQTRAIRPRISPFIESILRHLPMEDSLVSRLPTTGTCRRRLLPKSSNPF